MALDFNTQPSTLKTLNNRGVALIMVLWVMAILTVIVLEFSFAMRTELHITRTQGGASDVCPGRGGAQRAIAELIFKHDQNVQRLRRTLADEEVPPEKKEWLRMEGPTSFLRPGTTAVRIMSEGGKININTVSENRLRRIIENLGLEGEKETSSWIPSWIGKTQRPPPPQRGRERLLSIP